MVKGVVIGYALGCLAFGLGVAAATPGKPHKADAPQVWSLVHVTKGLVQVDERGLTQAQCVAKMHKPQRCVGYGKLAELIRAQPKPHAVRMVI